MKPCTTLTHSPAAKRPCLDVRRAAPARAVRTRQPSDGRTWGVVLRHIASAFVVLAGRRRRRHRAHTWHRLLQPRQRAPRPRASFARRARRRGAPRVGRPGVETGADRRLSLVLGLEVNVDYVAVSRRGPGMGTVRYERRRYGDNRGSDPCNWCSTGWADTARGALDAAAREGLRPIGISVAVPGLVEEASGQFSVASC